jgi:ATPase subunit of ABC transporter with duplicated ATPase domains
MTARVELSGVTICAPGGRPLFDGLTLRLSREHVALIGRNGVGKSTLLAALAGAAEVHAGRVKTSSPPHFVPQVLHVGPGRGAALSHGELRRLALAEARASGAEVLLLDEPTEDLDDAAVAWLRAWLRAWPGCLVVASHDRRLLGDFRHFFIAGESGCRALCGSLADLENELEREHAETEQRYVRNLHRLAAQEEHTVHVARRKARKKRYGRCRELDRATSRVRLNQKRSDAQVSQGRLAKVRDARLDVLRQWSLSSRRALGVSLALVLPAVRLPEDAREVLVLSGVSAHAAERVLVASLDLRLGRQRLGVVGPNGAGKTTLLEIMLGRRASAAGSIARDLPRLGAIEQGAGDWMLDDSLLNLLILQGDTLDDAARRLVAQGFPLALADRPLCSLSPGERTRAALIALFRRSPPIELLVLDEPTFSLDLVGQRALTRGLRAWPGGLVVASHDRAFLTAIGTEAFIELGSIPSPSSCRRHAAVGSESS